MYKNAQFKESDKEAVIAFMQQNPFAMLIGTDANLQPVATQIPVLVDVLEDDSIILSGHIVRHSEHHTAFLQNANALVVFSGAHTYVSATWYTNQHQASTWNYMTVQAAGTIRLGTDEELIENLRRLSLHFEKNNSTSPTYLENLSSDYVKRSLKGIVFFSIEVKTLENVFKLSQNRDEQSYATIIERLKEGDADAQKIAEEMEKRKGKLFS